MQRSGLISLVVAICLQFSFGSTDDIASKTNSDALQDTTLSRAKRGSYDMMRLGRGLHMLRLGKRNDEFTVPDEDVEDALNWLKAYNEHYSDSLDLYNTRFPEEEEEEEVEIPAHFRSKRSTPDGNGPISDGLIQQINQSPKESVPSDLKDESEDEQFVNFPEDNLYLTDDLEDSIIQPQEGGDEDSKRSMAMLRLGKRQLSMLRLGKRSMAMLRLGKRESEDEEEKRSLGMLRLGKRQLSMLRLGKRSDDNFDEVDSEDSDLEDELNVGKRPMSMLRLGKRPMSMLRLGKRPMSMLRLGKRPMSMLRLGKRPMSMLRLGKRPMSMLRLGKRPMSMLRLGKRPMSMLRLGKRPMSMLRLGKRPMSMLRLGKREEEDKRAAR